VDVGSRWMFSQIIRRDGGSSQTRAEAGDVSCKKCTAIKNRVYVLKPPVLRSPMRRCFAQCFNTRTSGARGGTVLQSSFTRVEFRMPSWLFIVTSHSNCFLPSTLMRGTLQLIIAT